MQIPNKVKILGHEYSVIYDEKIFMTESSGCAKACANTLEITLSPQVPESRQAEALMHEIFEMIKYTLNIELDHQTLSALSELLFAVIRDNGLDFRRVE